jgi:hypothetical protein
MSLLAALMLRVLYNIREMAKSRMEDISTMSKDADPLIPKK